MGEGLRVGRWAPLAIEPKASPGFLNIDGTSGFADSDPSWIG
jgi:hypothetical protein